MEDIVRQSEGRRAERPRSSARRAAKEAAKEASREASREVEATRGEGTNVVRLGVDRLTTLVTNRFPKFAPEPPAEDAPPATARTRVPLPQVGDAKSWAMRISFAVCVALPTFFAILYYGLIASDQYVSEFRFSVRPSDASMMSSSSSSKSSSGGGMLSLAMLDNYIVDSFVRSRQAVDELDRSLNLKQVYGTDRADFWARLNTNTTSEGLVKYWDSMIDSAFDLTSGISIVRIRAFSPEEAHKVATQLMRLSEALVNDVNARSRKDAIRFAEEDLRRAEDRLKAARTAIRDFRASMRAPDPVKDADATFVLASKMREQIVQYNTELYRALGTMAADAPTVVLLRSRLKAVEEQLKQVEGRFGESVAGSKDLLPAQLAQYEDLDVERMFAEKLYSSALATLEMARSNANMQHTYVSAFVEPGLPQKALYPQRILSILIILLVSLGVWCAGLMLVYSIKDHTGR